MPASPHVVTFPGKVRIIDNGPRGSADGQAPGGLEPHRPESEIRGQARARADARPDAYEGLGPGRLPARLGLAHTRKGLGRKPEKPLALVKVVPDGAPAPAALAELAHTHEETSVELPITRDEVFVRDDGKKSSRRCRAS